MLLNDMAPPDVLDIATTADKYNFVDALRLASEPWLQYRKAKADKLLVLIAAAYAFQNESGKIEKKGRRAKVTSDGDRNPPRMILLPAPPRFAIREQSYESRHC